MLSHLKSYLFGGGAVTEEEQLNDADDVAQPCSNSAEEDEWVLVDSKDVITELPSSEEDDAKLPNSLEESWIVTQETSVAVTSGAVAAAAAAAAKSRQRIRQPKGTKPRRLRLSKKPAAPSTVNCLNDVGDADSVTSSIAIIPSPEHRAVPASSSSVLNASLSHAKQVAAIASSRVKAKAEKNCLSRHQLLHGNKTLMAASGRNSNRRCHRINQRMCGSNNNRKSHHSRK